MGIAANLFAKETVDLEIVVGAVRHESGRRRIVSAKTSEGENIALILHGETAPVSGASWNVRGTWDTHPEYGRQLDVTHVEDISGGLDRTALSIARFLEQTAIPGMSPAVAARLAGAFGTDIFETIGQDPNAPGRAVEIPSNTTRYFNDQRRHFADADRNAVRLLLAAHDLPPKAAPHVFKRLNGRDPETALRENPYALLYGVEGIDFEKIDAITESIGMDVEDPARIRGLLRRCLEGAVSRGATGVSLGEVEEEMFLDGMSPAAISAGIAEAVAADEVVRTEMGGVALFDPALFAGELALARRFSTAAPVATPPSRKTIAGIAAGRGMVLSDDQVDAVRMATSMSISAITGGPGTGKTTVLSVVLDIMKSRGFRIAVCAPTGVAAKRAADATGTAATTIHRLIEMRGDGSSSYNESCRLPHHLVVVDETSMGDVAIMARLVKAMHPRARLLLVGDVDQLPSVGPGNVLSDVLSAGPVAVSRLTRVHRLEDGSGAGADLISAVRSGSIEGRIRSDGDLHIHEVAKSEARIRDAVVDLVSRDLPARGYDPLRDVMVISPVHAGDAGVESLNDALRQALNADSVRRHEKDRTSRSRVFRYAPGDRIMYMRNDADRNVFNGDVGTVERIDDQGRGHVTFQSGETRHFDITESSNFVPAYATTIHKAQGSEAPVVVIPLSPGVRHMDRELIYTAMTRYRRELHFVGESGLIATAAARSGQGRRLTALKRLLAATGPRTPSRQRAPVA